MTQTTREKGFDAEQASYKYLEQQGLKLLETNYHCRHGEIDLIMKQKDTIVFIEVRYRKNNTFGGALESITPSKQQKVKSTVEHYIQSNRINETVRIDVVGVSPDGSGNLENPSEYNFDWIQNAF